MALNNKKKSGKGKQFHVFCNIVAKYKIQNTAIYALFKAILAGEDPAIRQFLTLCNPATHPNED